MVDRIRMQRWKLPDSYYGFSPDGDYGLYARNRDSDILTNSNFECLKEYFAELCKKFDTAPPKLDATGEYPIPEEWVYAWTASCWAHGWREYLMVRQDAPSEIIEEANKLFVALQDDYPVFDEDDYSRRQDDAIWEYWEGMSIRDRAYYCQRADVSIFAARRNEIPNQVYDVLYDCGEFA